MADEIKPLVVQPVLVKAIEHELGVKPSDNDYVVRVFCKNCRTKYLVELPKGVPTFQGLCPYCECNTLIAEEFQ